MAIEDWMKLPPPELIKLRHNVGGTTPDGFTINRILEHQHAKQTSEDSGRLVASTNKLVAATHRLGTVTWWLVAGTFLLGASAAVDVILKIIRGAH